MLVLICHVGHLRARSPDYLASMLQAASDADHNLPDALCTAIWQLSTAGEMLDDEQAPPQLQAKPARTETKPGLRLNLR